MIRENIIYQDLYYIAKGVLKGKYLALFKKKTDKKSMI